MNPYDLLAYALWYTGGCFVLAGIWLGIAAREAETHGRVLLDLALAEREQFRKQAVKDHMRKGF